MSAAAEIASALGGHRAGANWMARCPCHSDRTPSLSLRDGADGHLLVHCHAGCSQQAVIAALRSRGLWREGRRLVRHSARAPVHVDDPDARNRAAAALSIWHACQPAVGTLVETYLRSRAITLLPPETIRFHPSLKHPSGRSWPAMVALVTDTGGRPVAIHRTFLAPDGSMKAPVEPQKLMLGPCRGGGVHLATAGEVLMVGEGIETCLAAMQATRKAAWAALSTSGIRVLTLPDRVRQVVVVADGDLAGEAAAWSAAKRWRAEHREVRIARAPAGTDFNDLIMGKAKPAAAAL